MLPNLNNLTLSRKVGAVKGIRFDAPEEKFNWREYLQELRGTTTDDYTPWWKRVVYPVSSPGLLTVKGKIVLVNNQISLLNRAIDSVRRTFQYVTKNKETSSRKDRGGGLDLFEDPPDSDSDDEFEDNLRLDVRFVYLTREVQKMKGEMETLKGLEQNTNAVGVEDLLKEGKRLDVFPPIYIQRVLSETKYTPEKRGQMYFGVKVSAVGENKGTTTVNTALEDLKTMASEYALGKNIVNVTNLQPTNPFIMTLEDEIKYTVLVHDYAFGLFLHANTGFSKFLSEYEKTLTPEMLLRFYYYPAAAKGETLKRLDLDIAPTLLDEERAPKRGRKNAVERTAPQFRTLQEAKDKNQDTVVNLLKNIPNLTKSTELGLALLHTAASINLVFTSELNKNIIQRTNVGRRWPTKDDSHVGPGFEDRTFPFSVHQIQTLIDSPILKPGEKSKSLSDSNA